MLHEPGEPIKFTWFMNRGLTSILNVLPDGKKCRSRGYRQGRLYRLAAPRRIQHQPTVSESKGPPSE